MTDSALPANPLDVDQVGFDNAEHRRAFYDALIASGRDKVREDRRRLYEHKFIDEQGDPIPTFTQPDMVAAGTTRITFFRHGESTGNAGASTSDPEQIARWHWRKPTLIVASPYGRTRGTAAPLEAHFPDVPVEEWPVQEFTYLEPGRFAGTTGAERSTHAIEQTRESGFIHSETHGPQLSRISQSSNAGAANSRVTYWRMYWLQRARLMEDARIVDPLQRRARHGSVRQPE